TTQPEKKKKKQKKKKEVKNWTSAALAARGGTAGADVSAWKDLFVPPPVLQALSCLGFAHPTPIQALALPPAIRDHLDVLGAAETGSGKTLSFGIPILHNILEWKQASETWIANKKAEQEAAANQTASGEDDSGDEDDDADEDDEAAADEDRGCVKIRSVEEGDSHTPVEEKEEEEEGPKQPLLALVLTAPTRIRTAIVVGGMAPQKQNRVLSRRPEIVIATPGRLWDLIKDGHPHLTDLRHLR
ncbi:ATP-dependent RNA helicase DDX24-like, partial [Engraulis encrasicolus]|uniref:ATP-dependent RNA helicase DDX24-like n=1 Tax=Engraulis encrasicolus TaxID=184585 RepID=UPI002FD0E2D9